ncbi:ParB/RepB/Spo0J family partition protein [Parvularcula flava]|uniref:Chromosome partitioning protein ParB n=1 Tax=Aquisalinus luteolus TaxID=1566827 RepID=A0A8J3A5V2_9PROT|nr:ParB/RepB/Spo0J family partition protein [Aquisalinus luteolus]NHK27149.1 ParB/RepB/Spo0J family partition protein [Aquisalinus luteolus]GGH94548.1 chromosome partitioning protein ParB [Aquisalinus luteolus]
MAQPTLKSLPLSKLRISRLNMRHGRKAPDVSDIVPSIRASGIRQTLLVRKEGDHYGIVAGRRRYFALKQIEKETGKCPLVPCAIMPETDAASAIAASVIENVGRLPATEMEQYTAFRKLHGQGRSVEEIAAFFGVTELRVRRVLALASLAAPIRKLYEKDEIDRETIRALTLATADQQGKWLRLHQSRDERAPRGRACRAWITGGSSITTDKALFDLTDYEGQVTADLFGEHGVFADPDMFWQAQSAAIAGRIETYIAAGWTDVVCLDRGAYFQRWEHDSVSRRQGGKVFVECRHDGSVIFHEGYLCRAEARRREKAKRGQYGTDASARPEMSGPLADYILLHRHGAAQASLAARPSIALRLMVAHAMTGSALWQVRAHDCASRREATRASLEASKAASDLDAARRRMASLLEAAGLQGEPRRNGDAYGLCEIFAVLLAMPDAQVMEVLAVTMAGTLEAGGPVVEAVLHVCGTDLSAFWQPEPAFFELARDKRAINAMLAHIGSQTLAKSCSTDTAKRQKEIIVNRIAGEGCAPDPAWRPGWMQVPPRRLVEGAGSPPADHWARIAALFRGPEEALSPDAPQSSPTHAA